jgi:hypothetical protein
MRYLVTWEVDIEDVETPEEAAAEALKMQRDPDSVATYFEVRAYVSGAGGESLGPVHVVDFDDG